VELHQLSITYDAAADRLLLKLRGQGGELLAAWLTRRLMQRLWPVLQGVVTDMAASALPANAHANPDAKAMLSEMRRADAVQQADFHTPFEHAATAYPMGQEPLLIREATLTPLAGGRLDLGFKAADGRAFHLQLAEEMAQAWVHLTEKALGVSEWSLPVGERTSPLPPTPSPSKFH
jgi:hypothetical protein